MLDPAKKSIRFQKRTGDNPHEYGFRRSSGWPRGQSADWRLALPDGSGLHLQDFGTYWETHWDRCDPSNGIARHVLKDMPLTAVAAGAFFGWVLGRGKEGAFAGGVAVASLVLFRKISE